MLWGIDPWKELERMKSDLDGMLGGGTGRSHYGAPKPSMSFPLTNAYENKDDIRVVAELPGLTSDSVNIMFNDGILTIAGKREAPSEVREMSAVRRERSQGDFEKIIEIPVKVESDKISASFENGILTVVLPKAEEAKPRQITIEVK